MTMYESAAGAVRPWNSLDAESEFYELPQQQSIEVCLTCKHCASRCDNCPDWNTTGIGRPRKTVDTKKLSELLRLKRCNAEVCSALGISERTLQRLKKTIDLEDHS